MRIGDILEIWNALSFSLHAHAELARRLKVQLALYSDIYISEEEQVKL